MNWLEFIASVVGSVAWPVAAFAIAFLLRKQIRHLIGRIRRLALGENAIDFSDKLDEAEAISAGTPIAGELEHANLPVPDQRMQQLIALSPAAAVLDAWRELEVQTLKLAQPYYSGSGPNRDGKRIRSVRGAARALLDEGVITGGTYALLLDLNQLRNAAAHTDEVTTADAVRFANLAEIAKRALTTGNE